MFSNGVFNGMRLPEAGGLDINFEKALSGIVGCRRALFINRTAPYNFCILAEARVNTIR